MPRLACGIVGLPNVGKSTLFNALTRHQADASNYPFCTIDPNVGIVEVPDERIPRLAELSKSKKQLPAVMEFVDIAGLVAGASQGEGLGNQFLSHIREVDAIAHVVRCFEGEDVVHVGGHVDPVRDIGVIEGELILADLQMVENSLGKVSKQVRGKKELQPTLEALEKARAHLETGTAMRALSLTEEEKEGLVGYPFLTQKPVLYICNVSEDDLPSMENEFVQRVREHAAAEGNEVIPVCAKLEQELSQFEGEEQRELLESMGLEEPGLNRLIRQAFHLLGLVTFLTTGEIETRAWTIVQGMVAPQAAGQIHTDIQKGFIRAEVVSFDDMVTHNGRVGAREAGRARMEGKEYTVQDGDVILFHHN